MIRIIHIISALKIGGAEMMLLRLLRYKFNVGGFQCLVISLTDCGTLGSDIKSMGIKVITLNMTSILSFPISLIKLIKIIFDYRPNVVQTWMYHADLIGGLAARICGVKKIVWNIRNTRISHENSSLSFLLVKICSYFSFFIPTHIICCAKSVFLFHVSRGFCKYKMSVINNGYEFSSNDFSITKKIFSRERLGLNLNDFIIGIVGRFDVLKDYKCFILAAAEFIKDVPESKFILAGRDVTWNNNLLVNWISESNLTSNFILLGEHRDINELFLAMDIFCSSSKSEGFPNVVAEAMTMRVPCVVTDVGDSALIIGDSGILVPPENYIALSKGFFDLYSLGAYGRFQMGIRAREQILCNFSMDLIGALYLNLYNSNEC